MDPNIPSNAIGNFTIGISPIGDIALFNWRDTVLSQYANSPTLMALMELFFDYFDQTQNFDSFYDLIWNVDTAQGYGLDVWGRIVGVSRVIALPPAGGYFGFEEQGLGAGPWNQSPFYNGVLSNNNFALADAPFRTLIYAKALANICNGSIQAMNQILLLLFPGRGNIYVTDGLNMTMTITSTFTLTPVEIAILTTAGVFPRPAGVALTLITP